MQNISEDTSSYLTILDSQDRYIEVQLWNDIYIILTNLTLIDDEVVMISEQYIP